MEKQLTQDLEEKTEVRKIATEKVAKEQAELDRLVAINDQFFKDYTKVNPFWQGGSCAWGDAAVIIPWTLYEHYGDTAILEECYPSMTGWVDWIDRTVLNEDGLWEHGFKFGDWLALDGMTEQSVLGRTDSPYISSMYYYASTSYVAQAAQILYQTSRMAIGAPGMMVFNMQD